MADSTNTAPYKPLFDYNRYSLRVLMAGPAGIEAFDEWMVGMARYPDMDETVAEWLFMDNWAAFAVEFNLRDDQLSASQALFA